MRTHKLLATLLIVPALLLGSCSLNKSTVMNGKKDSTKTFATVERLPSAVNTAPTVLANSHDAAVNTAKTTTPAHVSDKVAANTSTTTSRNWLGFTRSHKVASPEVIADAQSTVTVKNDKVSQSKQSYFSKLNPVKGTAKSGGKKWVIALILCIFLGGLGIHRFYLGYTWQGVVQLLTGGGCGVWALIDLIRIITRDLQPKDGQYVD